MERGDGLGIIKRWVLSCLWTKNLGEQANRNMFSFVSFMSVKLQLCPGQLYIVKEYNLVQQKI